jgi:hypothetical protein
MNSLLLLQKTPAAAGDLFSFAFFGGRSRQR